MDLPVSFFDEEIRDGYLVSSQIKRVWAVELNILSEFISICNRNNLKYYADGGTMLGAVRHRGFIPWDNDIDVIMPRPDFNKFISIAESELKGRLFLQTPETEEGRYFRAWAKICDSHTTGGSVDDFRKGLNCGISIDVFPLDRLPGNRIRRKLYLIRLDSIRKSVRFCYQHKKTEGLSGRIKYSIRKTIYNLCYGRPGADKLFRRYVTVAESSWNSRGSVLADVSHGYVERFAWQESDWAEVVMKPFETLSIIVPSGYDAILTTQYGDYLQFPKDKATHDYNDYDPNVPYTEHFKTTVI